MIARDLSWLSFNQRVLQEAGNQTVPLSERIKFIGIYSNNMDEFFRVRVAAVRNMIELGTKAKMHLEDSPAELLKAIQGKVVQLQKEFDIVWKELNEDMNAASVFLVDDKHLTKAQQQAVLDYFNEEVRSYIVPLMIQTLQAFPTLNDKSTYLACRLLKTDGTEPERFALVSVPVRHLGRFLILPSTNENTHIILLEDVIRFCLPLIFSFFGYDKFSSHIIKLTRDAEIDIDNDLSTSLIQKLEKGLKNRKKGKPVRFVYDREIDPVLLLYILKRIGIKEDEKMLPGGRIHNFKDFMGFPNVFTGKKSNRKKPFTHPRLVSVKSVTEEVLRHDCLLNFPYHSFDSVIDLLREAAIDPSVLSIKITCYRLASRSKIVNALTNAVRNGKAVTVMLELRARFDEEANLSWKLQLEEAGVKVLLGAPNEKVHGKLCVIKRRVNAKTRYYGFVSTGNLNEKTAKIYSDHLLFTSDRRIMADANKVFNYLEHPKSRAAVLQSCKFLQVSPYNMRSFFIGLIDKEIKFAQAKKKASIIVKLNSLSDKILIEKLTEAAKEGVDVKLIIRGICCMLTENKKFKKKVEAISIIDEFLEHARVIAFRGGGSSNVFISSADWMVRNLDHRVEVACPITDKEIKKEILSILNIQLSDNVKARKLDNKQRNLMAEMEEKTKVRSQIETYNYLYQKTIQIKKSD